MASEAGFWAEKYSQRTPEAIFQIGPSRQGSNLIQWELKAGG